MAEQEPRDWTEEEQQEYFALHNKRSRVVRDIHGIPRFSLDPLEPSAREAELLGIHRRKEQWILDKIQKASDEATAVLMSLLSPEQRKSAQECKQFNMVGSNGKDYTFYLTDWQNNIAGEDRYGRYRRICAHIKLDSPWYFDGKHYPPVGEHHLAQYLMLKANAPEFVETAL